MFRVKRWTDQSVILSHIEADGDKCTIQVGGSAVMLAEGDIKL